MKKSPLPKSRAKTAYGLLSEVRRLILAEPLRYHQERFIARTNGVGGADRLSERSLIYSGVPACGTVGCVAGWVATLTHGSTFDYSQTQRIATSVLGLGGEAARELFSGAAIDKIAGSTWAAPPPQTEAYARLGSEHIAAFQRKYAAQLKRKRV